MWSKVDTGDLSCEELRVVAAPLPPRPIEKCLASDRIVIDTVVSKYCNHTPLHRWSMILEGLFFTQLSIERLQFPGRIGNGTS
jgi:transposase